MTVYYVRASMGNDGNTGLSPAQAWLTVDKAANEVAAGDDVYIGAGVYRETVTIDTSGTNGSEIRWFGDIDGAQTGDNGLVVITVNADEVGTGGTGDVINLNGQKYNEFYYLVFGPGGSGLSDYTIDGSTGGNSSYEGVLFDTCVILQPHDSNNQTVYINHGDPGSIAGNKLTIRDCYVAGLIHVIFTAMAADVACGIVIENCRVQNITLDGPAADTEGIEGYEIVNNVVTGLINILDQWNTGTTGIIANNFFPTQGTKITIAGDGGTWTVTDNMGFGDTVTTGTTILIGALLGHWVEPILHKFHGWSPYRAFEPVYDMTGGGFKSGVIEQGNATYAPAADMYGEVRPMLRNADDIGAGEARARGEDETGTVRTDTHSLAIKGAGYHDMHLPVDAALTTVTVYGRYDGNYTGSLPILEVLDIPGVADQSDVMTGAAGAWEQVSCTFTPTSAGYVRVRLRSQDTSANGECFFDDLEVS